MPQPSTTFFFFNYNATVSVSLEWTLSVHSPRGVDHPYISSPRASQVVLVVTSLPMQETLRDVGSIPGLGRSPGGRHGHPLQYSCLENPMDRGAWRGRGYSLWVAQSRTRLKRLSTHVHTSASVLPPHPSPFTALDILCIQLPFFLRLLSFYYLCVALGWLYLWMDSPIPERACSLLKTISFVGVLPAVSK